MRHRVIVGVPAKSRPESVAVAARLVRALGAAGHEARILFTEPCEGMRVPDDVACDRLPAGADDSWGQRWESLERYLEERAPCFHLMLHDWRHAVVAPRLSRRVRLVALVGSGNVGLGNVGSGNDGVGDDGSIESAARCCEHFDAIVATSDPIHFTLASRRSDLAPRIATIHDDGADVAVDEWNALFARIDGLARRGGFARRRDAYPSLPDGVGDDPHREIAYLREGIRWPDAPDAPDAHVRATSGRASVGSSPSVPPASLEACRVLVASTPGAISGVDVFAQHLVRGLRARGFDARLHGRRPDDGAGGCPVPDDLPYEIRPAELDADYLGWPQRWQRMTEHLATFAPCIYVPNYDLDFSCIAPMLPPGVHVVGIGHSDDPWHYEHLCRIGHACDAIVGVSGAIASHLEALAPAFASRLSTIPYGIAIAPEQVAGIAARRNRDPHAPLRIAYSGRLVRRQKRALDVVAVARALAERGVAFEMAVVGDGELRGAMERAGRDLVLDRRLWFTGAQPNPDVLRLLASSDALLLPSLFEGLSVGMLEAMSCGVVPVVSDIRSGVPDLIVHGENGLVAPVGDVDGFASLLESLARDPVRRHRLSEAAHRTVAAGFGVDRMVERYVEVFRRAIADPLQRPCGPVAPPPHLESERGWSSWIRRVASDPAASVRRIAARLQHSTRP